MASPQEEALVAVLCDQEDVARLLVRSLGRSGRSALRLGLLRLLALLNETQTEEVSVMAEQLYEYYCDVVETGRFDRLHSNLNDTGRKAWRLVHVVPCDWGAEADLLLVWERPLASNGQEGGLHG